VISWKNTNKNATKIKNPIFKYGVSRLKTFFLRNSSGRIINIGTVVKANSKSITGKNIKKIGEGVFFNF
jgi:hypothetical protein